MSRTIKKKRKKIAVILATSPNFGGGHQYAVLIAECLAQNSANNYELVAICCNPFWKRWCMKNNIKYIDKMFPDSAQNFFYLFPFFNRLYNRYMTPMGKTLRKEKVDILFSAQQLFYIPDYGLKIIVPVHDLMHRYESSFPEVQKEYDKREAILESYASYAYMILTDSKMGKRQFEETYLMERSRKPYVISLPFIVPQHIYEVREEEIAVPEKYVFYPAQFWKHKNHMNLVKAIHILKEKIEDIHLVLAGSGRNSGREIKDYIQRNRLENNITILGFVSDENITYLYKHAVGMIMPSYFGPTNLPPLEAMALGCPVAVSDKYAMPEQVGDAGLLFNPDSPEEIADCIERLWTDNNLREKMKVCGYKRIRLWDRDKFCRRLMKIVNKIEVY